MFLCCEPIVRNQCFLDLKNKANLKSVQPKDYKKWGYSNETTPLKWRGKKCKYDINLKRTPQMGLNRTGAKYFNHTNSNVLIL